jgi:hypothetical protein
MAALSRLLNTDFFIVGKMAFRRDADTAPGVQGKGCQLARYWKIARVLYDDKPLHRHIFHKIQVSLLGCRFTTFLFLPVD